MEAPPERAQSASPQPAGRSRQLLAPGMLLGLGLGGFVDGIVLHQILQWHHMLSNETPPTSLVSLRTNVTADGFFHVASWLMVLSGLLLLWHAVRAGRPWTWRTLLGWSLVGWGTFNLVEGVVDHHLLEVHRVRPSAAQPLAWDLGFLALGLVLVAVGLGLARTDPAIRRGRGTKTPPRR